ncbi:hypothetical protein K445DRAFT_321031 [Daldinia sp. EC12]|nr:hypothetical protein K445DRAFT_321031 [Daldinia sp. EC12]
MASSPGTPATVAQALYLVGTLTLSSLFFSLPMIPSTTEFSSIDEYEVYLQDGNP